MISSTAQYALRAVVFLANYPNQLVSRATIAEGTLVPHEYLLKVLNALDDAQLVQSKRGPGGGYQLTRSADEISSLDVVLAVDDIPRIETCPLGISDHTSLCPLHKLLDQASQRVEESFAQVTIADLAGSNTKRACNFPNSSD